MSNRFDEDNQAYDDQNFGWEELQWEDDLMIFDEDEAEDYSEQSDEFALSDQHPVFDVDSEWSKLLDDLGNQF